MTKAEMIRSHAEGGMMRKEIAALLSCTPAYVTQILGSKERTRLSIAVPVTVIKALKQEAWLRDTSADELLRRLLEIICVRDRLVMAILDDPA